VVDYAGLANGIANRWQKVLDFKSNGSKDSKGRGGDYGDSYVARLLQAEDEFRQECYTLSDYGVGVLAEISELSVYDFFARKLLVVNKIEAQEEAERKAKEKEEQSKRRGNG
jgi:hypothetical protein